VIIEVTFHKTVCQIWKEEIIPEQYEDDLICPIHKRGDPIRIKIIIEELLYLVQDIIFSPKILYEHLQPYMVNIFGKYQCGFRKGKSTISQIQSIRLWRRHQNVE